jgi:hypothetical protein
VNTLGLDTIIVGDMLDFTTSVNGYPATDGWTLKYRVIPRVVGVGLPILLTAATASDGMSYRVQVAPSTTAGYTAADYTWEAWVEKTGARVTIDDGLVTVKGDPSTLTSLDGRSHARKVLDAIEALIETKGTADVLEYSIGGRSIKKMTTTELLPWRDRYRWEVADEVAAERVADGLGNPRLAGVRFNR